VTAALLFTDIDAKSRFQREQATTQTLFGNVQGLRSGTNTAGARKFDKGTYLVSRDGRRCAFRHYLP
jgi:hypothetical protein